MISFKQYYLLEDDTSTAVKAKLKHLEHIEELIINEGPTGATRAIQFVRRLIDAISTNNGSNLAVNIKVDGAPSITMGLIPKNDPNAGEFFVGTKSALSPTGKRYTKQNAHLIDSENSSGLAEKLKLALRYLPELGAESIYQGDFMFSPLDLKKATINGKEYITFRPNTITYAVEANSDSGREVSSAKIGIVFHTVYEGDSIADMHATFNPDLSQLNQSKNVWWKSNRVQDFSHSMPQDDSGITTLTNLLERATQEYRQIDPQLFIAMASNPKLGEFIKMHINSKVRQNQLIGHVEDHIGLLQGFIDTRHLKDIEKYKTTAKKEQVARSQQQYAALINQLRPQLIGLFKFFNTMTEIKLVFLKTVKSFGGVEAFYKHGDEYTPTSGEGLVIADTKTHEIVKVVDRIQFSQQNFNMEKDW